MKQKRLGKKIAAWLMCLAMVLTTINLPAFTAVVQAASYFPSDIGYGTYLVKGDIIKAASGKMFKYTITGDGLPSTGTTSSLTLSQCLKVNSCEASTNPSYAYEIYLTVGHNYTEQGSKVSDATCTSAAIYNKKCPGCSATSGTMSVGSPLGHNYSVKEVVTEATCATPETYNLKCSRCSYVDGPFSGEELKEHNYISEVADILGQCKTEGNCTVDGVYYKYCKDCNSLSEETFTIPASGMHRVVGGICEVCGYDMVENCAKGDHYYISDCDTTCEYCGYVRNVVSGNHDFSGDATKCKICDLCKSVADKGNHNYIVKEDDHEKHICSDCGNEGNHDFSENGTCACGLTQVKWDVIPDTQTVKVIGPEDNADLSNGLVIPDTVTDDNGVVYDVVEIAPYAFGDMWENEDYEEPSKKHEDIRGSLVIGSNVTTIGDFAFGGCDGITGDLIIPDSVTTIGDYAFSVCGFTGTLSLGKNVTSIGFCSFSDLYTITGNLEIPNSVLYIGPGAFTQSSFTGDLIIPGSIEVISDGAFADCTGFKGNLTMLDGVTTIGESAFARSGFTGKVTIPNSVTSIGNYAFSNCGFTEELEIPNSVTTIGDIVFAYCRFGISIPCFLPKSAVDDYYSGTVTQRNHDFSNQPYQTDDAGKHYQICTLCDAESEHVECTPGEAVKEDIVAPTCAKPGSHNDVVYCTVCNQKLGETSVEDAATGKHSYKNVVTKATLTTNGKIETKCSVCGDVSSTKIIYAAKTVKLDKVVYTYDGKTKKPSVIIKDSKGNLIPTSNYTVTYPTASKKVGEYTVKVTFKGNYKGSKSLAFKINPVKTAISSLTAGSKSFTVKWAKKTAEVTGYQIQYSTSDKFKTGNKTVTITKNGIVKKQIKNLKAGKKYFVRIRTYKTVGKVKFYSEWSAKKSVTTKK